MKLEVVNLGHGSGGFLTRELVRSVFLKHFANPFLEPMGDSALLPAAHARLAMTTDAFVVSPLFFAGGDIGRLAVFGTVNDLAVACAVPLYVSAAFVLEEGFAMADLERIAISMARAAEEAGVMVVAGDTKVVEKGHGDKVFIVTAGVGLLRDFSPPDPIRPGDRVLVSGPIGDHGAVIAAHRMGLDIEGGLQSDTAPVTPLVDALFKAGVSPKFLRDPTRGGIVTVLAEMAYEAGVSVLLEEGLVPIRQSVMSVCEILGLDPLYLACEGRVVAVIAEQQAQKALAAWHELSPRASMCGKVVEKGPGPVLIRTTYGGTRVCDMLAGEQLSRIC